MLLANVLNNRRLINTSSYDVILMNGAKNRVLTKNNRTMLVINPESQPEEVISLLSTVYTLDQLREPNSWLFTKIFPRQEEVPIIASISSKLITPVTTLLLIMKGGTQ